MINPTGSGSANVIAALIAGFLYMTASLPISAFFSEIASSLAPSARAFSSVRA
jgi:hypothetical protein